MTFVLYTQVAFFVAGAIMGSFGNMLIYRIPHSLRLGGRSMCPHCKSVLQPIDLIPIVSYLFLRGKCRQCSARIGVQYLLVEGASGLLFLSAYWHAPTIFAAIVFAFALWCLLIISVIDLHTQGIPDVLSLPFIILSLVYGYTAHQLYLLVFAVCTGFFLLQWLVSMGRWVGSGDVLLSIGMSALLGRVDLALVMLCTSYILGAAVALYLLSKKQKTGRDHLAFGPFLAIGTVFAVYYGDAILQMLYYT